MTITGAAEQPNLYNNQVKFFIQYKEFRLKNSRRPYL